MSTIIGSLTMQLAGGVRLIRSAKNLTKDQINSRLEATRHDDIGCQFCYLPGNTRSHDVQKIEQMSCVKVINITKDQYYAITRSQYNPKERRWSGSHPSRSALKTADMSAIDYCRQSEYTKLMVYYSDLASDMGAISYKIDLYPM